MPVVTKIISKMKVSPISIKRHEIAGTMYSEAEKDVDINADSLPPLPKRTPKYSVLACEHNTPGRSKWSELQAKKECEQQKSGGLITSDSEKCDHVAGGIHTETCSVCLLSVTRKIKYWKIQQKPHILFFCNHCGKPKGPRDPPSEWT